MLIIKIYKIINNIAPSIMNSLFLIRENVHNNQNFQILSNSTKNAVTYRLINYLSYGQIYQIYKS